MIFFSQDHRSEWIHPRWQKVGDAANTRHTPAGGIA
jgi:hypothetical protein